MLQSNEAHVPQQLSLCPRAWDLQLLRPACSRICAQQQEKPLERKPANRKEDPGQSKKKKKGMSFPFRETWVQILVSLVAQTVKHLPAMQETWVQSLGPEDPLEKEMATHPIFLPGKSHGQRNLVGCSPWRHRELDMTERLHFLSFFGFKS